MTIEQDRAVALGATQGTRRVSEFERISGGSDRVLMGEDNYLIAYFSGRTEPEHDRDAEFSAHFDAPRILSMLDRDEKQAAEIAALRKALEWYADPISYAVTQAKEPRSAVHGDDGQRARQALSASERRRGS